VAPDRSTGRVTKVANLGRAGETVDDLDHPTATFSYTFATFADDTWTPASAHTTTRRVHWMGSETTDFDEAWVYFDGSGRELLSKARAAPHPSTPSTPRFVGSGRVLLDAKGNPVKQYEPYFSATSDFEPDGGFDGVTPVLSYDPLGRLVRTDFPDGTHATVVRTPWSETHYDRADTLPDIDGYTPDPEEEPDEETLLQAILREFEAGVPGTLATGHPWLDARGNTSVAGVDDFLTIARGKALRRSAGQSWASRNTPTVVHVDPLGRPFLEQRAKTSTAGDTTDVHVTLDLQGRATAISARYVPEGETVRVTQLATTDVFDLLGRSLRHVRRDAQASGGTGGQTWVLPSVDGQPIRTWDSRDQAFRRTFDALRRPRATFVEEGSSGEFCRLFTRYGERATTPKAARLLGQPWRVYDTAGLVTTLAVDVDNRVTSTARRFLEAFRGLPDWSDQEFDPETASEPTWLLDAAGADPEVYTQTATLDIAGRPLHDAVYRDVAAKHERRYGYDAGGQLVSVEVQSPGTSGWRPVVHDVTYNARGQRTKVLAGDDTGDASLETTYSYDADTFRLVRLAVTRLTDDEVLQDIRWVHDAVGNVTFQEDLGTDAVWFDNTTVQPHREYAYDALDRLIEATGREHQSTFSATGGDTRQTHRPYGLGPKAHAADGNALRSYTQRYEYDDVGNLRVLRHVVGVDTTERTYAYTEEVDGSLFNNRLLSTTVGSTTYPLTYDAHGNVTSMSHLPEMAWDAFDRLASVQTTARYPDVGADDEDEDELETPVDHDWFYVYDGAGQRVRKVRAASSSGVLRWEERLYVGPFEVWRKYDGSGDTLVERETLHVQDGDRRVAMVETLTWDGGTEETSPAARWRYQLDDHLGTACGEVTETGLVIGWEEYHPYGTTAVWSFDATREVSGKRYRYTGMERDDETGLGYHSARYYAGWLGRWVSPDPIGVKGGMNLFGYSRGAPVGLHDRSGSAPAHPDPASIDGQPPSDYDSFEEFRAALPSPFSNEAALDAWSTRSNGLMDIVPLTPEEYKSYSLSDLQTEIDRISRYVEQGEPFTYRDLQILATVYREGAAPDGTFAKAMPEAAEALRLYISESPDVDLSATNPWRMNSIVPWVERSFSSEIDRRIAGGQLGGVMNTHDSDMRTIEKTPPLSSHIEWDTSRIDNSGTMWGAMPLKMFFDNRFSMTAAWSSNGATTNVVFQISDKYDFQTYAEQRAKNKMHVTIIPIGFSSLSLPDGLSAALAERGWARAYTRSATWSQP
jgi:RHS repeat-associated protein